MGILRLTAALGVVAALINPALAGDSKAVVELFTSQGCSSCPAADKVLGELASENRVIALSLPVDYWDYLGWRDTLAQAAYTQRQRGYSQARGDHEVYTPQAVINGTRQAIGSDRAAIEAAAQEASHANANLPVTLTRNGDNLEFAIGAESGAKSGVQGGTASGEPMAVWLLAVATAKPVAIDRGENHGRTIIYHNVVRSWRQIGEWRGAPLKQSVPLSGNIADDTDMVAVLVQAGSMEKPGPIRAAATLRLR